MRRFLRCFPTIIALLLGLGALNLALAPSGQTQILVYSFFRFTIIVLIACTLLYLLASFRFPKLLVFNNWCFYGLVSGLLLAEISIRTFPSLLPNNLIVYLPVTARENIAGDRGFFTEKLLTGEGLLYHFRPGAKISDLPWLKIDKRGYRNPVEVDEQVDVVFVGDSVTLAQAAEKDFADHFRANGFTALNLGMNGYSTLHYRDAFRKFVFEPKIQVRYLIVVISGFNDHHDSLNYARTSDATGDFRRYLGQTPSLAFGNFQSPFVPWTVSILGNAIPMIKNVLTGKVYGSEATVELDYTTVTAGRDILQVDPITENDLSWRYLFQGLNDLLDMAAQKNIRTLIAYYPPTRLIVGPYLKGFEELRAVIQADHRELMALYRRTFNGPTVRFVDLTEFVSKTAKGELVTLTPLDYHLNASGSNLTLGDLV